MGGAPGTDAVLNVTREHLAYADRLRAYKIVVDGVEVGRLRNGESKNFSVPPGRHLIEAHIDWTGSSALQLDLAPGSTATLIVSRLGNMLSRNQYLALRHVG